MGDTPTYCLSWSYKLCFLSPKGGVNIRQGGDCCSMWLIFVVGQTIGWGGGSGVFLEFSFLRVSINTLLCNPNLNIVKILFPYSSERRH